MKDTTTTTPDPIVKVQILTNGILIGDAHHAAGKVMDLPKSKADVLVAFNPPAVKILGV
jgi:hypothetical protein